MLTSVNRLRGARRTIEDAMRKIHPTRAVALMAAVTVLLIAVSVGALAWEMRKRDLERARLDTASLAHMLREQTERNFDAADQVLAGVQERMQTPYGSQLELDSPAVRLLLGARVLAAPHVDVLAIANARGEIVNASQDDMALAGSIAGAAYFKAFASGAQDRLFIDAPVRTAPGEWTLDLARPFTDGAGKFRGVVVLTMKAPRLEQFNSWLKLDYARPAAVYLADGTLVASAPAREELVGTRPPEVGADALTGDGREVRTVTHMTPGGAKQVFAFARAGSLPMFVSVMSDDEQALASWRERAASIAFGALLVCGFTVAAAVVLTRELGREERLARALRDAHDRYHRTIDSLMDAIVSVDASHNITLFNPAAERMFGIAAAEALGAPVERLIPVQARGMHAHYVNYFMDAPDRVEGMQHNPDITGLRADGVEFPLETSLAHTLVDGKPEVTAVLRDVTERRRAEQELRETNRQLRALSASLQEVREQERTRIARELHDELGQQLTGLKLELSWLTGRMKEGRPPTIDQVDAMRHHLDATIASVRRIATELRPRVLDDIAFGDALKWLALEFARRTGLRADVELPAVERVVDTATATALFRIVQESLTNIARHAHASNVLVRLEESDDALVLRVRDDGCGGARAGSGLGLVGMRERAMGVGGLLAVSSEAGCGTTIEVIVPLHTLANEEEEAVA